MIGRLGTPISSSQELTRPERAQQEPASPKPESPALERPTRESTEQAARSRKQEMAISSIAQKAVLSGQLQSSAPGKEKIQSTAKPDPPPIKDSGGFPKTLQLGDKGKEVSDFQYDLLAWQVQNNLPMNVGPNAQFTGDTENALKQFQAAHGLPADGKADGNTRLRLQLETDPNFRKLSDDVKNSIRFNMNQFKDDPVAQKNLMKLSADPAFSSLSQSSQQSALSGFMMHPSDPKHCDNVSQAVSEVATLEKDGTLNNLPKETQEALISTLFKKTNLAEDSKQTLVLVRQSIVSLAKDPLFAKLTAEQQQKMLDGVAGNPDARTANEMNFLLHSGFVKLDDKMKARVIDLAKENALYKMNYENTSKPADLVERLRGLRELLRDPAFLNAPDDEKWAQLNAFKTSPPMGKNTPIA